MSVMRCRSSISDPTEFVCPSPLQFDESKDVSLRRLSSGDAFKTSRRYRIPGQDFPRLSDLSPDSLARSHCTEHPITSIRSRPDISPSRAPIGTLFSSVLATVSACRKGLEVQRGANETHA